MSAKPGCLMAALINGISCALSPEKLCATNEAPNSKAKLGKSMALNKFTDPALLLEPSSAVAESCPLVNP